MLSSIFSTYAAFIVRQRRSVLALGLLATVLLASNIATLKIDNNPDLWAPQDHPFVKTSHQLEQEFGGRHFTVIGILPRDGNIHDPAVLASLRRIQAGISQIPEAVSNNVISLAADKVKDIAATPDGMVVRQMLDAGSGEALREALQRNPVYDNTLVSNDRTALALIADFRITGEYTPVYDKIRKVIDSEESDRLDIILGGEPIESANLEAAMNQMPLYFGVAFLVVMVVQLIAFRSLQGMFLPMLTALVAVVWGLGGLALLGIHLDALNSTTPILIIAIATGHAVQILKRYYEELGNLAATEPSLSPREVNLRAVEVSLARVAPVTFVAGVISALAFFSLSTSSIAMLRHFGIFAGIGVIAIMAIEFTLIPAIRALLPAASSPQDRRGDWLDAGLGWLGGRLANPRSARAILGICVLVIAAIATGLFRLEAYNSFKQYSAPDSQIRQEGRILDEKFGGTNTISFLVTGPAEDSLKDPRVMKAMMRLQEFLSSRNDVGKTVSIADMVRRMNLAMHGEDRAFDTIPDDRNLIAQYLFLYSMSGGGNDFNSLIDSGYRRAVVWAYLRTDNTQSVMDLYRDARQVISREFPAGITVEIGGGLPETVAINDSLVQTKVSSIVQMAVVVFLLASLTFGSLGAGLLVAIPLGIIVLANLGMMGWLGIPLDMGTATTTAMVAGIGADYEIYMLYRLREEYERQGSLGRALQSSLLTSGKAVIFVALSIAGGYSALLMSDFQFYPRLGATMMATMFVSCLLSILLLRSIIVIANPRFIQRSPAAGVEVTE